ncbi:MAG: D-2-hydroxyacid dehydrogenase [Christensenellaceae bacterium]|jgi:glycerate dehydrogenase|nr:D-2-hydroxyacid dehydrogenase [Christensenellaceae bacterium]
MYQGVILDGYTSDPKSVGWARFTNLAQFTVFERTPKDKVIERCKGADIIITNKCLFTKDVLEKLPVLKYIGILATGYNNVDLAFSRERGIVVSNVPAYSTESVVQQIIAHLLNIYCAITPLVNSVKEGKWAQSTDFCYYPSGLTELFGATVGIIGYGRIGRRVSEVLTALGLKVLVYNKGKTYEVQRNVAYALTLDELYAKSKAIILACPLTADNTGMVNADSIAKMQDGTVIINTARGGLLNEQDVAEALNAGKLAALGADVLSAEPPLSSNPLLTAKNTYITPHTAWATEQARARLIEVAYKNCEAFLNGTPQNKVN